MTHKPDYRFKIEIVDQATDEIVISDFATLGSIDQFGGSEAVDMYVATMLRAFNSTVREEYERKNYQVPA